MESNSSQPSRHARDKVHGAARIVARFTFDRLGFGAGDPASPADLQYSIRHYLGGLSKTTADLDQRNLYL